MELESCRKTLGPDAADLTDEQIQQLADVSSALAAVVVDAFAELGLIDQSKFYPPGDPIDYLNAVTSAAHEHFDYETALSKAPLAQELQEDQG